MQRHRFSQKKFLSLPPKQRCKKIADLAREFLEHSSSSGEFFDKPERQQMRLQEIRSLLSWIEPDLSEFSPTDRDILNAFLRKEDSVNESYRKIYDLYQIFVRLAGLGPRPLSNPVTACMYEDSLEPERKHVLPFRFCLWNLRSAHNAGAILRSLDCFGFEGLILAGYTAGPESRAFRAASMGTEGWVPVERIPSELSAIQACLRKGQRLLALETTPEAHGLNGFSFPKEGGILLAGNEELGLPSSILEACEQIRIPMFGRKASLNVSNACAVAAYEIRRSFMSEDLPV